MTDFDPRHDEREDYRTPEWLIEALLSCRGIARFSPDFEVRCKIALRHALGLRSMSAAMTTEVKALGGGNRSCEGSEWLTDALLKSHDGSQSSDGFEQRCKKALHLALNLNDANVALGSHRASGSDLKASPTTVAP